MSTNHDQSHKAQTKESQKQFVQHFWGKIFTIATESTQNVPKDIRKYWEIDLIIYALFKTKIILVSELTSRTDETDSDYLNDVARSFDSLFSFAFGAYAGKRQLLPSDVMCDYLETRMSAYCEMYENLSDVTPQPFLMSCLGEALHWFLYNSQKCAPIVPNRPAIPYDDYYIPVKNYPEHFQNIVYGVYDKFEFNFIIHISNHMEQLIDVINNMLGNSEVSPFNESYEEPATFVASNPDSSLQQIESRTEQENPQQIGNGPIIIACSVILLIFILVIVFFAIEYC